MLTTYLPCGVVVPSGDVQSVWDTNGQQGSTSIYAFLSLRSNLKMVSGRQRAAVR